MLPLTSALEAAWSALPVLVAAMLLLRWSRRPPRGLLARLTTASGRLPLPDRWSRLAVTGVVLLAGLALTLAGVVAVGLAARTAGVRVWELQQLTWIAEHRSPGPAAVLGRLASAGEQLPSLLLSLLAAAVVLTVTGRPGRPSGLPDVLARVLPAVLPLAGWALERGLHWVSVRAVPTVLPPQSLALDGPVLPYPSRLAARAVILLALLGWPLLARLRSARARAGLLAALGAVLLVEACSQVYLARRWPADVTGGLALGCGVAVTLALAGLVLAPSTPRAGRSMPEDEPVPEDGPGDEPLSPA